MSFFTKATAGDQGSPAVMFDGIVTSSNGKRGIRRGRGLLCST